MEKSLSFAEERQRVVHTVCMLYSAHASCVVQCLFCEGMPIVAPVAGVAIGLVTRCDSETNEISEHRLLTDILVKCCVLIWVILNVVFEYASVIILLPYHDLRYD